MDGRELTKLTNKQVILVGASSLNSGPVDNGALEYWATKGKLVAVDGGLNWLMAAGLQPEQVIGDMDSADPKHIAACRALGIPITHIAAQDNTDLEKALLAYPEELIIGLGFLDGRIDHSLAALHALVHAKGVGRVLLVGAHDALIVCCDDVHLSLPQGARISIWPIGQVGFHKSTGLVWPLDGLDMEAGKLTGTSNQVADGRVSIYPIKDSGKAPSKDSAKPPIKLGGGHYAILVAAGDWEALYKALSLSASSSN